MRTRILSVFISVLCLWACGTKDSSSVEFVDEIIPIEISSDSFDVSSSDHTDSTKNDSTISRITAGMIEVFYPAQTIYLGTDEPSAKPNEKPKMGVSLNYNFFMDIHEFTNTNDSLPLTNVTYFDVVLIANAKSKKLNLDTVYTYTGAIFDEDGHCVEMEGLVTHFDVEGFRLPTEAEWILAASQDYNPEKSWNGENSGNHVHKVCSNGFDKKGFCDFSGNVTEWTNDWLGTFRDTSITNFVGATDGGEIGERVIKGANFNSIRANINLYSRGDVYSVTAATMANYVGFRLVLGKVPNPIWLSSNGHASASKIEPIASSAKLKSYTGSYNMKLVFRNDVTGNLAFIDYNNGSPKVFEILDTINSYHPVISPDGKFVAFCTKFEGVQGTSTLYVRPLSEEPAKAIALDVKSAAIPRWRILDGGDTAIVYVTDAGNNADAASWKSQSTWQVSFSNGKFGTTQKLQEGSFHGGISKDNRLAVTGARLLRARLDNQDAVWYSEEQACNVSLAQDGTKRTAFLDFGGKTGREFAGIRYRTHQRILIADSTGKLIQTIPAPANYTFDHSEWISNNVNTNLIATLTNINGAHKKIVLVSPADSSVIDLAEGEELWHPYLWIQDQRLSPVIIPSSSSQITTESSSSDNVVSSSSSATKNSSSSGFQSSSSSTEDPGSSGVLEGQSFELNVDSAGMYYRAGQAEVYAEARYKMELLWQYKDTADVVIIGSSRALHGVAPTELDERFFGVNLAFIGNTLSGSEFMYNNYIIPHMSKVKYIVSSIDIDRGFNTFSGSFFNGRASICPGYVYDKKHNYWKDGYPEGLAELTYNSPGATTYANKYRPTRGLDSLPSNYVYEITPQVDSDSNWIHTYTGAYETNFNSLTNMVKTAYEKGIYFIGVIFPQNPNFKNTGGFGRYGILRSEAPALLQEIADLSKTYPNFVLFDENKMGDHDYTSDMANDRDHLAYPGAIHFTARLDSLLKTLPPLSNL